MGLSWSVSSENVNLVNIFKETNRKKIPSVDQI